MFPSHSITNTILIGNPVIALTALTQHAAQLRSSFVSNPDSPYIASSVVSQSVDLGQNNNPNTTPTKDYENV